MGDEDFFLDLQKKIGVESVFLDQLSVGVLTQRIQQREKKSWRSRDLLKPACAQYSNSLIIGERKIGELQGLGMEVSFSVRVAAYAGAITWTLHKKSDEDE